MSASGGYRGRIPRRRRPRQESASRGLPFGAVQVHFGSAPPAKPTRIRVVRRCDFLRLEVISPPGGGLLLVWLALAGLFAAAALQTWLWLVAVAGCLWLLLRRPSNNSLTVARGKLRCANLQLPARASHVAVWRGLCRGHTVGAIHPGGVDALISGLSLAEVQYVAHTLRVALARTA